MKTLCCRDYNPPDLWCRACRDSDPANCTDRMAMIPITQVEATRHRDDGFRVRAYRTVIGVFAVIAFTHLIGIFRADTTAHIWAEAIQTVTAAGVSFCSYMALRTTRTPR